MRSDAASLLARLGRTEFRYREFSDAFADMELWPIFEAVLTDENVVGKPLQGLALKAAANSASKHQPSPNLPPHDDAADSPGIFRFYGTEPAAVFPSPPDDLREFLSHLSQQKPEKKGP